MRQRQHSGEVATGTVTCHGQARGIETQGGAVGQHPAQHRQGVVDGSGKAVLGGQAVIDGQHGAVRSIGHLPAQRVMGVEIADDPTAAVQVEGERYRPCRGGRPIQAHWHLDPALAARNAEVFDARHRLGIGLGQGLALEIGLSRLRRCEVAERRHLVVAAEIDEGLGVRIEHGSSGKTADDGVAGTLLATPSS